ncbi:MAG TPA: hypothetical protein VHF05_01280 [Candidatus Paceibacterota bacterium]|jgi:hypothetical protein|nr:hypothetical protein [Candidatus Paceibacterota bacterium]
MGYMQDNPWWCVVAVLCFLGACIWARLVLKDDDAHKENPRFYDS